jgi:serine/threonine-protein kinase HipA
MSKSTPVWVWLPGASSPVQAADLIVAPEGNFWGYLETYEALDGALPLDPLSLRLGRRGHAGRIALRSYDGLPGVVRDAMPSGYGADRLHAEAGRTLSELELLDLGVPDSVGALEVTGNIERKLAWRPHGLDRLEDALRDLDENEPSSRAIRRLNDDGSTSAGGERPKLTVAHDGSLWLAKMRDRGDVPYLPAREFVTMRLAEACGIRVPRTDLKTVGVHQVFLIERFDRGGDPAQPTRRLFASAHTVLGLGPTATRGDPERSYLALADKARRWCRSNVDAQLMQLWRRMAFNGLVGNTDDHPRNHGFLHGASGWELSPAFDITPAMRPAQFVSLAMATGQDGSSVVDAPRLLQACEHFDVEPEEGARWLIAASRAVAEGWQSCLRAEGVPDGAIAAVAPSFALAGALAEDASIIERALDELQASAVRRRRSARPRST